MNPVAIVIPAYCPTPAHVAMARQCIASIQQGTAPPDYELIIIENGSHELEWGIKSNYFSIEKPLGCVKALNIGFNLAAKQNYRPQYIVNISTDIIVPPMWLPTMLYNFESNDKIGVLAPMDGESPSTASPLPREIPPDLVYDAHFWGMVMLSTAALCAVGPMDENLNHCYGDQDYNIRMRQAGYRVARTGNVVVKHGNRATYSAMPQHDSAWKTEKAYMIEKWGVAEFEEYVRLHP